jgi:hypothetical protein
VTSEHIRVDLRSGGWVDLLVDVKWLDLDMADLEFVRDLARMVRGYSEPVAGEVPGEAVGGGWSEPPAPTTEPLIGESEVDRVRATVDWPTLGVCIAPSWEERDAAREQAAEDALVAVADSGGSTSGLSAGAHVCDDPECFRTFVTRQGLGVHRRRAHGSKWPALSGPDPVAFAEEADENGLVACGVGDCVARRSVDAIVRHRLSMHGV